MSEHFLTKILRELVVVEAWACKTRKLVEQILQEVPMGREAEAIAKLQNENATLTQQLAAAQAVAKDAADIAAENSVLGEPTSPSGPGGQVAPVPVPATTAADTTAGAAATTGA